MKTYEQGMDPKKVKEAFKGVDRVKLAAFLGVEKRNYIDQIAAGWLIVSAKRAKEIERGTGGKVPAKVLRPDIFDD